MELDIFVQGREPKPRIINVKQYSSGEDKVIFTFDTLPEQGGCYIICDGCRKELVLNNNVAVWDIGSAFTKKSGCFDLQLGIESADKAKVWRSDLMLLIVSQSLEGKAEEEDPCIIGRMDCGYRVITGEDIINFESES